MINNVTLVGRLTRDPEMKYTPSGVAVANFTLAVNRPFKNKETNENEADFINITVWRKQAENVANWTKKGHQVGVVGRIQTRNYDGEDGKKVYVTEVVADSVQFLESKGTNQNSERPVTQQNKPASQTAPSQDPFANDGKPIVISDDDLPF